MTVPPNPDARAALQYLVWALEEIEKSGHQKAAQHARIAMEELQGTGERMGRTAAKDPME